MPATTKVLITVKTYPLPSETYMELVCTAGVREDGSFVRIYPVDYRYRPYEQWYKKYQWVEIQLEKNEKDPRAESFRPVSGADFVPIGEPLDTGPSRTWGRRKKYVLAREPSTMCQLNRCERNEVSLGIVKLREAQEFVVEPTDAEWPAKAQAQMAQQNLFGSKRKPLEKVPFKFSYRYTCDEPGCKGHNMQVEDWEIYQLYRKMRDKFRVPKIAVEKVRQKWFDDMCGPKKDTYFYVGTVKKYGTWIVLGVFWPPRQ